MPNNRRIKFLSKPHTHHTIQLIGVTQSLMQYACLVSVCKLNNLENLSVLRFHILRKQSRHLNFSSNLDPKLKYDLENYCFDDKLLRYLYSSSSNKKIIMIYQSKPCLYALIGFNIFTTSFGSYIQGLGKKHSKCISYSCHHVVFEKYSISRRVDNAVKKFGHHTIYLG